MVRYTLPTTTKAPFTTASRLAVFGPPFAGRRCRNGTAQGASSLNPGHAAFLYSSKTTIRSSPGQGLGELGAVGPKPPVPQRTSPSPKFRGNPAPPDPPRPTNYPGICSRLVFIRQHNNMIPGWIPSPHGNLRPTKSKQLATRLDAAVLEQNSSELYDLIDVS